MATFKVTLTITTPDYEYPTKWLIPLVTAQLDEDECLDGFTCELNYGDEEFGGII